jgi:hypothetical protein
MPLSVAVVNQLSDGGRLAQVGQTLAIAPH